MTSPYVTPPERPVAGPGGPRIGPALLGATLALCLAATACGAPGGGGEGGGPYKVPEDEKIKEPVSPEQLAKKGDVTLRLGIDANLEAEMERVVPRFEEKYPNVDVEIKYKSFEDQIKTVIPTLKSGGAKAPDLVGGNQGYSIDGAMVEGGLARPIDDIADAYGWSKTMSPSLLSTLRWSEDGRKFGVGDLYGIAPDTQNVGIFYNKKTLDEIGVEPPETFADFEKALAAAKDAGEQPLLLGNAEGYGAYQAFGIIQAAHSDTLPLTEWINGSEGADFVNETNLKAADGIVEWVEKGYFQEGYNSLTDVDATTKFGEGEGVFMIAGDWNATSLVQAKAKDIGFLPAPKGKSGAHIAQGAAGLPWHVNAKTKNIEAVAAFLGMVMDEQNAADLAEIGRIPRIAPEDTSDLDPLTKDAIEATQVTLEDEGLVGFMDYASDTMYDTLGAETEKLLGGKLDSGEYLGAIQKDWQKFQTDRAKG
ncbi:carbohydrate ABC transporter substrate-binding protein (CUT1 family) [Murinocardiopsis flavida]|uniref:Carbohydrate ABC transporter substrate-binding protein (CUT1 family) n=1 Tax=Murinocardiopsis flavida TaxID=645275 RepID=A0A2P8DNZ3_9ACTN|nr:extracellular solute-binding protein [Murinocardiopsis flavida]PSK98913.1 carbohydrate ABC transporter substrate-binding protein (CUT1 family) [Murinocardiopsis flavida]